MTGLSFSFFKRVPVFRNYLAANTISLLGTSIFDFAMPLYVWEKTHSPMMLALVSVALYLPYFLMAPLTGYAVDHIDNRKLMLWADGCQVLTLVALLLYEYSPVEAIWPVFIAVFACKTLSITFETAGMFHMIPALVKPNELSEANAWFLSSYRLIQILGPFIGGFIFGVLGFRTSIFLNLVSYGATLYFTYNMRTLGQIIGDMTPASERHRRHPPSVRAVYRSFAHSVRYIWNSPLFKPFVFAMFFWNVSSLMPNTPTFTYYFRGHSDFTPFQFGLITSLCGLTGFIGYVISNAVYARYQFTRSFAGGCFWQAALATLSLFFFKSPLILAFIFALSRVGSSIFATGTFLLRQTEVPRNMVGAVNSSIRMHFMSAAPLSSALQGILIQRYGAGPAMAFGALALWGTYWFARKAAHAYLPHDETKPLAA